MHQGVLSVAGYLQPLLRDATSWADDSSLDLGFSTDFFSVMAMSRLGDYRMGSAAAVTTVSMHGMS